jgi:hypothetical protein
MPTTPKRFSMHPSSHAPPSVPLNTGCFARFYHNLLCTSRLIMSRRPYWSFPRRIIRSFREPHRFSSLTSKSRAGRFWPHLTAGFQLSQASYFSSSTSQYKQSNHTLTSSKMPTEYSIPRLMCVLLTVADSWTLDIQHLMRFLRRSGR